MKVKEIFKDAKKRNIVIGIAVAILIILLVVVVICATASNPKNVTENMLKSLKEGNFDKAKEYVDYDSILGEGTIAEGEENSQEIEKLFYNDLQWKVLKCEEKGNSAIVEVEITNKNFKTIISNYVQQVFKMAFSGQQVNTDEISKYLVDELKKEDAEKTTSTQTLNLTKEKDKWKVNVDENLKNAILPGLTEALNSLGGLANSK